MKDYEEKVINIMDSAKDNIRIQFDKAYKSGYEDAKSELGQNAIDLAHKKSDKAYQQGLEDAWEVARKIVKIPITKREFVFDLSPETDLSFFNLLKVLSIQEVISKIKEYEEQQKKDTIQVGDEVYSEDLDWTFIVTKIITSKYMDNTVKRYEGICTDGACYDNLPKDIVKTGRHFDQIVKVLAEMRGEE